MRPRPLDPAHGAWVRDHPGSTRWMQRLFILLERITGWMTTHWITVADIDARNGRQWRLFEENVSTIRPGIDPGPYRHPPPPAAR